MNKKYIPGVIVVEGTHDVSKLSLVYDSVYVVTNGYDVPQKEINFLKALKGGTPIIVLTDKDEAGKKIRDKINQIRNDVINIEIEAPKNKKKKGIAECELFDIQKALDKYVGEKKSISNLDLYELGIIGKENSREIRNKLSNKFNLGLVNKNNMIKRLNILDISLEDIKKEIQACNK